MLADLIGQIVGEIVGYATGRVVLSIFAPNIRVLPLSKVARPQKHGRFALTYVQDGQRYFFDGTVIAVGILSWLGVGIAVSIALAE
jgi:hypothetical protein